MEPSLLLQDCYRFPLESCPLWPLTPLAEQGLLYEIPEAAGHSWEEPARVVAAA